MTNQPRSIGSRDRDFQRHRDTRWYGVRKHRAREGGRVDVAVDGQHPRLVVARDLPHQIRRNELRELLLGLPLELRTMARLLHHVG